MPGQTVGNVHIDAPLSNLARLYRPQQEGFIADEVLPYLDVVHESDVYYRFTQDDFFATDVDDLVPDKTPPRELEFNHDTAPYRCQRREFAWNISDRERGNADQQLNLERNKQNGVQGRLALKREIRVAALLRKTTNGGQLSLGGNAGTKWDNTSSTTYATVLADVMAGITGMRQAIGLSPNTIVIPAAVAEGLHKTAFFTGVQQYTNGQPGDQPLYERYPLLPAYLWGMRVLVPGQIKNTAVEGQTASYSDIWGEQVRLLYVTPGPALEIPSVGYTFRSEQLTTRHERDEWLRLDKYAVGQTIDERIVAPSAGWEVNDCLT